MALSGVTPYTYNLKPIVIGTDFVYVFTFTDSITGYSFAAKVQTEVGKTSILDFTVAVDTVNKRVTISLTDTQTGLLTENLCSWYLIQTDTDTLKAKLFTGKVRIEKP